MLFDATRFEKQFLLKDPRLSKVAQIRQTSLVHSTGYNEGSSGILEQSSLLVVHCRIPPPLNSRSFEARVDGARRISSRRFAVGGEFKPRTQCAVSPVAQKVGNAASHPSAFFRANETVRLFAWRFDSMKFSVAFDLPEPIDWKQRRDRKSRRILNCVRSYVEESIENWPRDIRPNSGRV